MQSTCINNEFKSPIREIDKHLKGKECEDIFLKGTLTHLGRG